MTSDKLTAELAAIESDLKANYAERKQLDQQAEHLRDRRSKVKRLLHRQSLVAMIGGQVQLIEIWHERDLSRAMVLLVEVRRTRALVEMASGKRWLIPLEWIAGPANEVSIEMGITIG